MVKVGIIGCGNISSIYMENLPNFEGIEVAACADIDIERAKAQAERFQIEKAYDVEQLLADETIDLVINLTIPKVHAQVSIQALEAGKHVYSEKPLAVTREDGKRILDIAKSKGRLVGSAPDTFLGAGIQTAIALIDEGEIGTPIGASAAMLGRGPEHWHPDPEFFYEIGGGPMFDMGPYYLTALVALLGPIKRISGSARISYPQREILSQPKAGKMIDVQCATHISGTLDFQSGAIATLTTSFDVFGGSTLPPIEVYGSEGTILVPDPNLFGGVVKIRKKDEQEFTDVPLRHAYNGNNRGLGVVDMVKAIETDSPFKANGKLAYHVLEAMHGFHDASDQGIYYTMESTCKRPESALDWE